MRPEQRWGSVCEGGKLEKKRLKASKQLKTWLIEMEATHLVIGVGVKKQCAGSDAAVPVAETEVALGL